MIEVPREFSERTEFPVEVPNKCRRCVTLARFAAKHADLCAKIEAAEEAGISGVLPSHWTSRVAKVGEMSVDEAAAFVSSHERGLWTEFMEQLNRMDGVRENQILFAEYVIAHCGPGVVRMISATEGVGIEAEVCGSTIPERVQGFEDAEIVRVNRSPPANSAG